MSVSKCLDSAHLLQIITNPKKHLTRTLTQLISTRALQSLVAKIKIPLRKYGDWKNKSISQVLVTMSHFQNSLVPNETLRNLRENTDAWTSQKNFIEEN